MGLLAIPIAILVKFHLEYFSEFLLSCLFIKFENSVYILDIGLIRHMI